MHGVGPPLVTPFEENGDVDYSRLRNLVGWVERRGVDFLVPCGSNSEAELLTFAERRRVVETVVDEASVPVLAGTGHPGLRETVEATQAATEAGADAALVVTPFYYHHDQDTLAAYYRDLADRISLPLYLYSVPAHTGVRLDPETVGDLASHPTIAGLKDSSGSIGDLVRAQQRVAGEQFDMLVGSGGVLGAALDAGATGGILALVNLFPERVAEIFDVHDDDPDRARELNAALADVNAAVTAKYGVPGLKWAMRERGAPAGHPRSPHEPPDDGTKRHLESLLDEPVKS
ncbi:dihydrodipicolinate synthase family protein [Halobacteriales archaeon QH_2_65_14]|nr:MAG: dihydrodipicolinate synthase family protein [Halobacteriales archaeon QH_2_65_14]